MATTISQFFGDLRVAYLNEPTANARRFTDEVLTPYFIDALLALYLNNKIAFYGLTDEQGLADLSAQASAATAAFRAGNSGEMETFLQKELGGYIHPANQTLLRDKVWEKASASSQRGQVRQNRLVQRQAQLDSADGQAVL